MAVTKQAHGLWSNEQHKTFAFSGLQRVNRLYALRRMKVWVAIVLAVVTLVSCSHESDTLKPFGWKSVSPEADSLVLAAEIQLLEKAPDDSIRMTLENMRRLRLPSEQAKAMDVRYRFFLSRLLYFTEGRDTALAEIDKATTLVDSVRWKYDYVRISSFRRFITLSDSERATSLLKDLGDLDYYKSIGDKAMEANTDQLISSWYGEIGWTDKSVLFMDRCDSLYQQLGFYKTYARNRINRANLYEDMGMTAQRDSVMQIILHDKAVMDNPLTRCLALRNAYLYSGDFDALKTLQRESTGNPSFRKLINFYEALLSGEYLERGQLDSAAYYSNMSVENVGVVTNYNLRSIIHLSRSQYFEAIGKTDSALCQYKLYMAAFDSVMSKRPYDQARLQAAREAEATEMRLERDRQHNTVVFLSVILVLLAVGGTTVFFMQRRQQRAKLKEAKARLDLERNRREMMAAMISVDEQEKMLGTIHEAVAEMKDKGNGQAAKLETLLKQHSAMSKEIDTFQDLFKNENPQFLNTLKERWPGLTEKNLKLASYIRMGLGLKQLARIMSVSPESVKQARWRLRTKLGLPKDVSLDEFLRNLDTDSPK